AAIPRWGGGKSFVTLSGLGTCPPPWAAVGRGRRHPRAGRASRLAARGLVAPPSPARPTRRRTCARTRGTPLYSRATVERWDAGSRPRGAGDPGLTHLRRTMKKDIHPEYVDTPVYCTCGNEFTTRSTRPSGEIRADVCSACHPFYTGKQKILDTGGRVARFEARYGKRKQ